MVQATVKGVRTRLILDTGSTDHVLTIELARRASLEATVDKPGTDHAGASVPSWRLGDVAIRLGSRTLKLDPAIAIKGPPPFAGWGVGGFLSPQRLHPSAFTVVDLVSNKLLIVEGPPRAVRALVQRRTPGYVPLSLPRSAADARPLIKAAIKPFAPVWACLNTGGRYTEFARSAVATLRTAGRGADVVGVSGTRGRTFEVRGQTLRVRGASFALSKLLVRESMKPDGLIGISVLRSTVMVLHPNAAQPMIWFVPASALAPGRR
jgi:hypothetical protein